MNIPCISAIHTPDILDNRNRICYIIEMDEVLMVFFYDGAFDLVYADKQRRVDNPMHWRFYIADYVFDDEEALKQLRLK